MVRVSTVGAEARARVRGGNKGYQERSPLREALAALRGEELLELQPEAGETLRRLKVMARRAAKEAGRDIQYGETEQDTLLVWLRQRQRRRRRRGADEEPGTESSAAQEAMLP